MQLRPQIQIQSILKAMTDVVVPAVDANNKLAQEQAQLCMGMLNLMAKQIPLQFQFDCDELGRLLALSASMQGSAKGGEKTSASITELKFCSSTAEKRLQAALTSPEQIEDSIRALRKATGAVVTQVYADGAEESRVAIKKAVLDSSGEQVLRDRSWLMMQGWEPDPDAVPDIQTLLAGKD